MSLNRHLENVKAHIKAGNIDSAKRIAESLLRQYSSKAAQAKIKGIFA
jgi:hypothetical protein